MKFDQAVSRGATIHFFIKVSALLLMFFADAAHALNCRHDTGSTNSYIPPGTGGFVVFPTDVKNNDLINISQVLNLNLSCSNNRGLLSEEVILSLNYDATSASALNGVELGVQVFNGGNAPETIGWGKTDLKTGVSVKFNSISTTERQSVNIPVRIYIRASPFTGSARSTSQVSNYPLFFAKGINDVGVSAARFTATFRPSRSECMVSHTTDTPSINFGKLTTAELEREKTVRFSIRILSTCDRLAAGTPAFSRPYIFFSTSYPVYDVGADQGIGLLRNGVDSGVVVALTHNGNKVRWDKMEPQRQATDQDIRANIPVEVPMEARLVLRDKNVVKPGQLNGSLIITFTYR